MKKSPLVFRILAILLLALALTACISPITPDATVTDGTAQATGAESLSQEELMNTTYIGVYEEPVTLTNGVWEGEPFAEGTTSKPTLTLLAEPQASGDLNGDGTSDAAVLLSENSGGSYSFLYLAAVLNEAGSPNNVATTLIGYNAQAETLTIAEQQIVVGALLNSPSDPYAPPSVESTMVFELQDDALVLVSE